MLYFVWFCYGWFFSGLVLGCIGLLGDEPDGYKGWLRTIGKTIAWPYYVKRNAR